MEPWQRLEPTTVQKVGWRTVVTKRFRLPDGQAADFQTIGGEQSHCIATIALTPDRQVVVSRQFRVGPEKVLDELPGGGANAGEDFELAARRELEEETGYAPGRMEFLGDVYKDAYTNTTWHFFLATDCRPVPTGQHLDEHEHVAMRRITIEQLFRNARSGCMTDAVAVFLALDRLKAMQKEEM